MPISADDGDLQDFLPADILGDDMMRMLVEENLGDTGDEIPDAQATSQPRPSDDDTKDRDLDNLLSTNIDIDKQIEDVDRMLSQELAQIDNKTMEDVFKGLLDTDQAAGPSPGPGKNPQRLWRWVSARKT